MKLEYIHMIDDENREITSYTNNYKRSDNVDTLGEEFSFRLVSNPLDENMKGLKLKIGGKVIFSNDTANNSRTSANDSRKDTTQKQIFTGIIVRGKKKGLSEYSYTCFDYAFYLNKSEADIQFNDIDGTTALRKLCEKYNIPLASVPEIHTTIKKVYEGQVISDVIKDILKQATDETGNKYRVEVRENKLYIEDYKDLIVDVELVDVIGDYEHEESMEDMKNRILVISSSEKHEQVLADVKDDKSIQLYGQLQKVEKVDDKKKAQALNIAKKYLSELNKITESFSIKVLGDDAVRSGRILKFNQPLLEFEGSFLVKNCTHEYGVNHIMTLDLIKTDI